MKEILIDMGLNEREAATYIALSKEKEATASHIAKKAAINRTTAYLELDNLMKKGLVNYKIKQGKRYYQTAPPEKFISMLDQKKERFETILPILKKRSTPATFNVEVFEGVEGIKTFFQDVLENRSGVLVFGATGKAVELLKYSYPHFAKKFMDYSLDEKALCEKNIVKIVKKLHHVEVRCVKAKAHATTIIYADKVAFQSIQKDYVYVTIITDSALNKTYRNYFEYMWGSAKPS